MQHQTGERQPEVPESGATESRRALNELFSITYEELRRLASAVKRSAASQTLNPTALVNEAWLKMAKSPEVATTSRPHFKRIAARAMRQVLVEAARHRNAESAEGATCFRGNGRPFRSSRHLRTGPADLG